MVDVKRAENNVQIGGMVAGHHAGSGKPVFPALVPDAGENEGGNGYDPRPQPFKPVNKIKFPFSQSYVKQGEKYQKGEGEPDHKPDLPDRHEYVSKHFQGPLNYNIRRTAVTAWCILPLNSGSWSASISLRRAAMNNPLVNRKFIQGEKGKRQRPRVQPGVTVGPQARQV